VSPLTEPPPSVDFPEKRSFRRYRLWFPVTLTADGVAFGAICRDASGGGLLVSSVVPLAVGTKVRARFGVAPAAPEHDVTAEVRRSESNEGELMLAFPFRLGLRFDNPIPELPDELGEHVGPEVQP
jgi:hypothetical protein